MEDNKLEVLMQSKNLVNTSYDVTAIQNRIFYYCLFSAQKEKNGAFCCTVKAEDLKKLIPNKNQRTLPNLKKALQTLKSTALLFEKVEEGDNIECDYNLIAGSEYNTNKGEFKIYFMERLYKHVIDYSIYAPLKIDIMAKFNSFYSQRLYELLRLWSRTGKSITKEFSITTLRFILAVESKYPEYKNFKQRVLQQAIKEINEVGNMEVDYVEVKEGRKVVGISFTFTDNEQKVYFKDIVEVVGDEEPAEEPDKEPDKEPANPKTLEDYEPYISFPEEYRDKFNDKYLLEFIKFCCEDAEGGARFDSVEEKLILAKAYGAFKDKKGDSVIKSKANYTYFLGIFKNMYTEYINSMPIY